MPDENIASSTLSDFKLNPQSYFGIIRKVGFSKVCLTEDKVTSVHRKLVSIYIAYDISRKFNISAYPTLENYFFGAVSFSKNADFDKSKYSEYGNGFDRRVFLSHPSGGIGRIVINFGVDMNSSTKIDNKKKGI